jgi:hypothetical protein
VCIDDIVVLDKTISLFDFEGNVLGGPFDLEDPLGVSSLGAATAHHYRRRAASTPGRARCVTTGLFGELADPPQFSDPQQLLK